MVLETTFTTEGGTAVLTDAMAAGRNERGHGLGAHSQGILLRRLACTDGQIEAEVSYAPRSASVSFDIDGAAATARSGWPSARPPCSRSVGSQ